MENSWITSVLTGGVNPTSIMGGGAGLSILYTIWQILKANRRGDKLDAAADNLYKQANARCEAAEKRVVELENERSKAQTAEARLIAENGFLTQRLDDLKARMEAAKADAAESEKARREFAYENSALRAKVEIYELRLKQVVPPV